ncbi:MAG: hypothetical protein GXY85_06765 [Candidatus Brocadiaceae bacterium]|nr:hypothetical protein [Candidatus Brocadiaceae bacterium]
MKSWALLGLVGLLLLCAAGCGKDGVTADTAPFEAAVAQYLAGKSMDMKVTEFVSLDVTGDAATAVCRLTEASGLYSGLGVRWRFTFERNGPAWRVTGHKPL